MRESKPEALVITNDNLLLAVAGEALRAAGYVSWTLAEAGTHRPVHLLVWDLAMGDAIEPSNQERQGITIVGVADPERNYSQALDMLGRNELDIVLIKPVAYRQMRQLAEQSLLTAGTVSFCQERARKLCCVVMKDTAKGGEIAATVTIHLRPT